MRLRILGAICIVALARPALADVALTEAVTVMGRAGDWGGIATSSNEGSISAADMALRPLLRPGEIVENTDDCGFPQGEPTMIYKMTSKDWVRGPMDRFSSIVHSAPTARIELKCLSMGRTRTEWINVDCLADEQFHRAMRIFRQKRGS